MAQAGTMTHAQPFSWSKQLAVGSAFWLCVALALEPGNLMHGTPPTWNHEVVRLGMASLLFGSAAPVIFWLTKACRLRSPQDLQKIGLHAGAIGFLSVAYPSITWRLTASMRPARKCLTSSRSCISTMS